MGMSLRWETAVHDIVQRFELFCNGQSQAECLLLYIYLCKA